ncbi:DHS-like NAD/FAD-binding domain-containing protein [Westerdykella ornata]|uniref:DHS-like NAD/FAD-binding domain-containing protein n=1 Tax=Westerdykella ornata TaxID=318751 RepID=A0A6A6JGW0_WESOR|nr:DHS-like NAD/FAD-binding domain-containing protein [Westerdykella ornata]KAF2275890.1 DHS-like NAD/FAD-binding domain-containing protein [Westerdykella ornata]
MTTTTRPLLRIPYTTPLPPGRPIPSTASTLPGAITALAEFLSASWPSSPNYTPFSPLLPSQSTLPQSLLARKQRTLILSGAGLSVASGLPDYRGPRGTYTLNQNYRPIYYHEFCSNHEARKRYWARSFLGWPVVQRARGNRGHVAVEALAGMGVVGGVVTQNVDALHTTPSSPLPIPIINLHGTLTTLTCLTCRTPHPRTHFQTTLSTLNPTFSALLSTLLESNALSTSDPTEKQRRAGRAGLETNPDGDISLPGLNLKYTHFRYPACPTCLTNPDVETHVDSAGALLPTSPAGILKPNVTMFGESLCPETKRAAERAVDEAARLLVVGSSLATYSAFRLVKRAREQGMRVGVVSVGGVRGEGEIFFGGGGGALGGGDGDGGGDGAGARGRRGEKGNQRVIQEVLEMGAGREGVRINLEAEDVLSGVVEVLGGGKVEMEMEMERGAEYGVG